MSAANTDRAEQLLRALDAGQAGQSGLRALQALEATDHLRRAGAPDGLVREVHIHIHNPANLRPVVAELLRWLQGGAR